MMYNPYPATYQPAYQQQPTNSSNMIWVQGEGGAKSHPVGPGSSQVLFDSESQTFYIKTVDVSGMPQPLRIFRYEECSEADVKKSDIDTSMFITREEFDRVIASLRNNNKRGNNNNGKSLIPRTNEQ